MKLSVIEKCAANNLSLEPSAQEILDVGVAASTASLQVGRSCAELPRTYGGKANLPKCRNACPYHILIEAKTI